ncbi:MAG: biopolymer transporter ExbD [Chromatiales bacterium]|nr:biopolymer transporter ExbD [Chromatiales bacterium]
MIQGFRRRPKETELNITTFMNLMVILVPFLLITAVFSEITTLQLNLPQPGAFADEPQKPKLQLELIIRGNDLLINNAVGKAIERVAGSGGEMDLKALSAALYKVKLSNPDHTEITLLLEQNTKYERLVALMDTVRSKMIASGITTEEVVMFPDISIGDAPDDEEVER